MMGLLLAPAQGFKLIPAEELQQRFSTPRLLFLFFAAVVVVGAVSTVFSKNNVAAVISLVATFFGLAAVYTVLSAHFLAAIQVLVYAGAIMVLFLFVIMLLNLGDEAPSARMTFSRVLGGGAAIGLFVALGLAIARVPNRVANLTPADQEAFGTLKTVGSAIFTTWLLPFEAVSLLLLVAMVGAVVVAKSRI
jgi:NADH-quinone oxidoreductase subunit J